MEIAARTLFFDDGDGKLFVKRWGEAAARANWQVHAFCLMRNHSHLVIETPQSTLVRGMHWLLGTYTARFNARHRLRGHLYSGRTSPLFLMRRRTAICTGCAIIRTSIQYARRSLAKTTPWRGMPGAAIPMYLRPARKRPKWLRVDRVFGEHGVSRDATRDRRDFSRRMDTLRSG